VTKRITMLTAALAASLLAQPPGQMRPNHDEIKTYLNLSDSQVQALEQIQQQQMDSVRPMMQQIGQKHGALNDLLQKGGADPAAVGKLVLEIDALQKSISQKQTSFADQARSSLTADQKMKLKALDDTRKAMPAMEQGTALNLLAPQGGIRGGPALLGGPGGFAPNGFRRPGQLRQPN
jgi:Spy/CpxP family protein refolding chaperone